MDRGLCGLGAAMAIGDECRAVIDAETFRHECRTAMGAMAIGHECIAAIGNNNTLERLWFAKAHRTHRG